MKILYKISYSVLSITLSCNDFLYNLSKDLIVCWSFSYCFLYLLILLGINSYNTLLPFDNPHAVAVDIGIAIKPIPVGLKVIELDLVAMITNAPNDFDIVISVIYFSYLLFDLFILSLKYVIISLLLLIWLLKLLTSFNFFPILVHDQFF